MLIGITGYARHGKDTAGSVLVKEYGFTKYAFADQLKELALAINPFVDRVYNLRLYHTVSDQGWEEAKNNPEVRRFLQVLGTGVRDIVGEDAWIRALVNTIRADGLWDKQGPAYGGKIVVTDVRFPNEAAFIQKYGGQLWRIDRKTLTNDGAKLVLLPYDNGIGTDHDSERLVSSLPADKVIEAVNIDALRSRVRETMNVYV
jgi:hypothetical protein